MCRSDQSRDEEKSDTILLGRHDNSICPVRGVKGRGDFLFIRGFISFILN